MNKNLFLKIVPLLFTTTFALGLNLISQTRITDSADKHSQSNVSQKPKFQILIVNCQSMLYSELCDFVSRYFTQAGVPHSITQRSHDNLSDTIGSKFRGFDLLIISGSQKFFPDSPEVKDVATLLKMAIEKNNYAFGSCFGLQLLAYILDPEEGRLIKKGSWDKDVAIEILWNDSIFENIGTCGDSFITRQYHNYSVPFSGNGNLGQGKILAKSKDGIEIIRIGNVVATQFHPESRYASNPAKRVFKNYLKQFISYN